MKIQTVEREEENLKLTTPQDIVQAEEILKRRKEQQG
jgi:2-C-methyl-D-erythritol 4-phosphate cytidylyltransferase